MLYVTVLCCSGSDKGLGHLSCWCGGLLRISDPVKSVIVVENALNSTTWELKQLSAIFWVLRISGPSVKGKSSVRRWVWVSSFYNFFCCLMNYLSMSRGSLMKPLIPGGQSWKGEVCSIFSFSYLPLFLSSLFLFTPPLSGLLLISAVKTWVFLRTCREPWLLKLRQLGKPMLRWVLGCTVFCATVMFNEVRHLYRGYAPWHHNRNNYVRLFPDNA